MSDRRGDWFSAKYDSGTVGLSAFRELCESPPFVSVFRVKTSMDAITGTFYLPPDATRQVALINQQHIGLEFGPCHKPADDGNVDVIFDAGKTFADHFPISAKIFG